MVARKLRVEGLTECSWYSSARLSTLGTSSAPDNSCSCLAAVEQFVTNHKAVERWMNY